MTSELYTHFDVLDRLRSNVAHQAAPVFLRSAKPSFSRLVLSVSTDATPDAISDWLEELFGPRYDRVENNIILEKQINGPSRILPVSVRTLNEDDGEDIRELRLRPTLEKPAFVSYNTRYAAPLVSDLGECPPVMTFHSFKGGMGRTTLALAFADGLVRSGRKVLFVDADFEAPGVSTMLKHVMPSPRVSFADALALANSTTDPNAEAAITLVAERLIDQVIDGLTVLPCTRDLDLPDVPPEALTYSSNRSAFFVGELLSKIGKRLGVDLIVVDLRAGLSELAASLFLDPRLQHVLITTLNGQAVDGTITLLERMKEISEKWESATGSTLENNLSIIINQIPSADNDYANQALSFLDEKLKSFSNAISAGPTASEEEISSNPFFDQPIVPFLLRSLESIRLLPQNLTDARKLLASTPVQKTMLDNFLDIIPTVQEEEKEEVSLGIHQENCLLLKNYAEAAIYAEKAPQVEIFPTSSLIKLAERHLTNIPSTVVLGDKGAGKTYTFMSLARSRTWKKFVEQLLPDCDLQTDALILPVTPPQDLDEHGRALETEITSSVTAVTSGHLALSEQLIIDAIETHKTTAASESVGHWRNFWLDLIAWRCGHRVGQPDAFLDFPKLLVQKQQKVIAIFDGIETIFKYVRTSKVERSAVEALLRAVPDWLTQLPDRQIGVIVFIREDVARLSLVNNFKQFEDRYAVYALKWNWAEAVALAFWVAQKAGAISSTFSPTALVEMDEEERGKILEPLWGLKLGPRKSREARSQEWVMSSLSDFNRGIKARDLVRFLYEAAKRTQANDNFYDQRLLSPRSMRDAIPFCSEARVFETSEENQELEIIFKKIGDLPHSGKELPWSREQALERIGLDHSRVLEENGVFFRDGDNYYVPEIYRSGLKMHYSGGSRRRVVTLMRRTPSQPG